MSEKEHARPHKIVPRARNYDLNRTRTTLTAKHKTLDLSISCGQNTGCEKMYLPWPQNVTLSIRENCCDIAFCLETKYFAMKIQNWSISLHIHCEPHRSPEKVTFSEH